MIIISFPKIHSNQMNSLTLTLCKPCSQGTLCSIAWAVSKRLFSICSVKRMSLAGHVTRMGENRGVHRVLVGKPEGKRPLGGPRHRWEVNIKMDLQEFGGGRGDWMGLAQDRDRWRALVGTVRNFRGP